MSITAGDNYALDTRNALNFNLADLRMTSVTSSSIGAVNSSGRYVIKGEFNLDSFGNFTGGYIKTIEKYNGDELVISQFNHFGYATTISSVSSMANNYDAHVFLGSDVVGSNHGDYLEGGPRDDLLSGRAGNDTLIGDGNWSGSLEGNDILYGNQGSDILYGLAAHDTIFGGQDGDYVEGNAGSDILYGNMANDTIFGGQDNDAIFGGQGDDLISGGFGDDYLAGNLGSDRFMFMPGEGADRLIGFDAAQGDRINLGAGMSYTVGSAADGSTLLALSGGGSITIVGIPQASFNTSWITVG
ncbi:calcium-binding protein [Azospirillum sp.]|uniref:calcium-binding protein n=1 Tax=Azospirillum sp. TaxID=34012 RepID=UPI002D3CDF44|nr:calcium-binding protein [Azospirillum sp.]HYD67689.1 calcium-binding protein [Azospirillum sp.]